MGTQLVISTQFFVVLLEFQTTQTNSIVYNKLFQDASRGYQSLLPFRVMVILPYEVMG